MVKKLLTTKVFIGFIISFTFVATLVLTAVVAALFTASAPVIWVIGSLALVLVASVGCGLLNLK